MINNLYCDIILFLIINKLILKWLKLNLENKDENDR